MAFEVKQQNGEAEPVAVLSLGSDQIEFDTTQSLLPRIIMSIRILDGGVLETLSKVLKARGKRHVVDKPAVGAGVQDEMDAQFVVVDAYLAERAKTLDSRLRRFETVPMVLTERTAERHRAEIRALLGFREVTVADGEVLSDGTAPTTSSTLPVAAT